jgi:hypothetical protein
MGSDGVNVIGNGVIPGARVEGGKGGESKTGEEAEEGGFEYGTGGKAIRIGLIL